MPHNKKPIPDTKNVTFYGVKTEYVDLLNQLGKVFAERAEPEPTDSENTKELSFVDGRTLFLYKAVHDICEIVYGQGSTDEWLEWSRQDKRLHNESLGIK